MAGAGEEGAPRSCTAKSAAEVSGKTHKEAAPGCSEAKAVVTAPPLPPSKNIMRRERVEDVLNWKREPCPRIGKIDPVADLCDELDKEMAEYQEEIRMEFGEKGYIHVPDGYEEEIKRCNSAAYKSSYLKVFGCPPPEDDD